MTSSNRTIPHVSVEDDSVNIEMQTPKGTFESRFVNRGDSSHAIAYLSSQTGCEQVCRMCHLTAQGKNTNVNNAAEHDFTNQLYEALRRNYTNKTSLHVNFMAKGEPLLNPTIQNNWSDLSVALNRQVRDHDLDYHPIISTILPQDFYDDGHTLESVLFSPNTRNARVYYSLYSVDDAVRKKWLPKAADVDTALADFSSYHRVSGARNKIHFSFINGVNDSEKQIHEMASALHKHRLTGIDINIVRYNPYSDKYGTESPEDVIQLRGQQLQNLMPGSTVKLIPRVGFDVKASCGMFLE